MPRKGQKMTPEQRQKITEARRRRPQHDAQWYAESAEKRFSQAVKPGPVPDYRPELGPCLIFTGATNTGGYGQFRYGQRNGYAHRYAWERVNGPIPDGLTIDHLCRVRRCVNVDHLEVVDGITNYLRGVEARNCCPNGHEYTEGNTVWRSNGIRRCRTCQKKNHENTKRKRSRSLNGLPDRKIKYDQAKVRAVIWEVRSFRITIAQAAREIGCNPNYLGRRIWQEAKRDVLGRDRQCCVICGNPAVDVHHRIPRGTGGSYDPRISFGLANLISVCRLCHDRAESLREEANTQGWLIKHGTAAPCDVPLAHYQHGQVWLHDNGEWSYSPPTPQGETA